METMTFNKAVEQYELYKSNIASFKKVAIADNLKEMSAIAYEYYQEHLRSIQSEWDEFYKETVYFDKRNASKIVYKYWKGYEMSRDYSYGIGISN